MNTLISKVRKSLALLSIGALLSTMVVVSSASAAWYDAAVAQLGDASYAAMTPEAREAALSATTSRQDAAVILHRALGSQAPTLTVAELPFTDKAEVAPYALNAVLSLYEEMIIKGNPNGTFTPAAGLNRAEFAVMLERAGVLGETLAPTTPAVDAEFVGVEWAKPAFQKAAAAGIIQGYPDGTWRPAGPVNKAEAMVLSVRATGGETSTPEDGEEPRDNGPLDGEETSIEDVTLSDAQDDTLLEGASEAVVAELEFDVEEGDAEFERADIIFDGTGNDEDQPWRVFSTVYLLDSEENVVAEMDVDSKSDWTETVDDDIYRVRMSGLGEVVRQDASATYYVAVDVVNSVDGAETPGDAVWTVSIEDDGLRFVDGDGVYTFETTADTALFSIEEEGADDEFKVRASSNDPDSAVLLVEDDKKSTEQTVFIFEVEADDKSGEVEIEELTLFLDVTNPTGGVASITQGDVIDEVTVVVDGADYDFDGIDKDLDGGFNDGDAYTAITDGNTETVAYKFEFDAEDFALEAGDKQEVEVSITFKSQAGYDNGTKVSVSADSADFDVVSVDTGKSVNDLTGSATSEEHQLFTFAVQAKELEQSYREGNDANTLGTFTLEFELTAVGEDVYIEADTIQQTLGTDGFNVTLSGAGSIETVDIDSDAQEVAGGNYYKISEGSTESFTVTAVVDNTPIAAAGPPIVLEGTAGLYQLLLDSVFVDMDTTNGGEVLVDLSDQDIETNKFYVAT